MDIEQLIYDRLCKNCPNAKKCHEECTTCEEYEEELENALQN